ncbi:glycoside hydrolase family 38 N-terminal domain-containing protein [Actinacidiphila oryziradicis]|uniref:Glycoside hydrolase n=1 Tax=Actinacidiphila oryziradicis TaxID=2571141 RepID=A0A4U0SPX7_9ACTN|nr:glycoside hydrolase family 38 C-terminal domain-containing protein [Actinacidiphila oryziradicis]TKA12130.1 glycoside hydrolase [Actinacidiphila oryziradicis]
MRISTIRSTDLFIGTEQSPRQVVRITVHGAAGPMRVRVEGPTVSTPRPEPAAAPAPGEEAIAEVGVIVSAPAAEGSVHRVTAIAEDADGNRCTADGSVTAAATGWTMWMVSHFHYDPVWWNTQAGFTEIRHELPDLPWVDRLRPPHVRSAFDLVRAHLDAARHDEDYRFVLAELDYLKPHWDAFPRDRHDLRRFLRDDRIELVGGSYNEPNTNLSHPESTIRNTVYGIGYQRDVLGGDPRSGWLLDVFGHDPAHPGLMADAGLDSSAWARGPFHNSGPKGHTEDITRMQFPSEFEWIAPSGRGVLTHYMAAHYTAGWALHRSDSLEAAMTAAYEQYAELKKVAATRNVMLPVGHDHNVPSRWCTEIHREWAKRYVWPRFAMGLPRDFFTAVRGEADSSPTTVITPQTRDMNPVFTGKDVSYIDTKQAQRAAETAVLDAERLATLATLFGERFPSEALDKAWRLLAYGAHHDAVTGTESDQVYIDLVGGWREAFELGDQARGAALRQLAERTDTRGEGKPVLVANTLSWARDGLVSLAAAVGRELLDENGQPVPSVAEDDGTVSFLARDVPSLGHRVYRLVERKAPQWNRVPGADSIENGSFRIEADPARGGALTRITDRRTGRELLRPGGLGAELVLQDEHSTHPVWGEGPWHLLPKGPGSGTGGGTATAVRVEHSPVGRRIVSEATLGGLRFTHTATLLDGADRIDFHTRVDGSIGEDRLLRVRFDLDLPGTLPVSEVGFAAIGRPFGFPESDAAEHLWTLDNPAHTWAGLSTTARIALHSSDGTTAHHAIGIAEVIAPEDHDVRPLLAALVGQGVTATSTRPDSGRYGSLDADSNLPDIRFALGTDNAFAEQVLAAADPAYRQALAAHGRVFVPAARTRREAWVPSADLRGPRDLPVLIVRDLDGAGPAGLTADLSDAVIDVPVPPGLPTAAEPATDYSAALVNRGTPSSVATADGTLYLSLMRSCTDWPMGIWLDGPRRTVPDGSSFALQHWTHDFHYSLAAGQGDWRRAGFVRAGHEANHPLLPLETTPSDGELPARASLLSVEPANVLLTALKPRGNPMASGLSGDTAPADGLTFRLYESQGRPTTATLRLHGGLTGPETTDLLEQRTIRPLREADGTLDVELGAADITTVAARPLLAPVREPAGRSAVEPVQPVFTRYWLHNLGPAPIGYLPATVHLARPDDDLVRITVSAAARPARGTLRLDVPPGLTAAPHPSLDYDLAPGEYAEFELAVRPDDDAAPGTYYVTARIGDDLGQLLEDALPFTIGSGLPDPLKAEFTRPAPDRLVLRLTNHARSELRGEAQLISPYGTWHALTPRTQGFAIAPGATATLSYGVGPAMADGRWWALAKVSAFGAIHYTETLSL